MTDPTFRFRTDGEGRRCSCGLHDLNTDAKPRVAAATPSLAMRASRKLADEPEFTDEELATAALNARMRNAHRTDETPIDHDTGTDEDR